MPNLLKIKRGSRAQLNSAVSSNALNLGEPYLISDEGRFAIGTGSNTFVDFAKLGELPTVNNGTLTVSIGGTAAASGTALAMGTGTGFTANAVSGSTYDIRVGPAVSALATTMTGATTGFLRKSGADTYTLDTNTYLTSFTETDTLLSVTGRGATTATQVTFTGGALIGANGSAAAGIGFRGATSGTATVQAPAAAGTGTVLTLPATTGTLALTSQIPAAANNAGLTVSIGGTAAASGTALAMGTGTGFTADASSASTYDIRVGPGLTALATFMNTATAGFIRRTGADTFGIDTSTYLTSYTETDTLSSVTGRGATTGTVAIFTAGATVGANGSAAAGLNFRGATSGVAIVQAAAAAGTPTLTLPITTGTLALTSDIPTVNNGALTLSGGAGASGTGVTIGTGTGFTANASGASTYTVLSGPALSALATFMTTATAGFIRRTGVDTYGVDTNTYLTGNQTVTLSGDATGSGATSISVTLANSGVTAGTHTKVTVDAKGRVTTGTTLAATDIPTLTAAKISDFDTQVRTSRLDQMAVPTAAVALNSQKITGLADPTNAQDAATKAYVDGVAQGIDAKASVRVATTANITLSGTQTIDGIAVVANDRVLVKSQTTPAQNGIYVAAAGAWSRASDADTWNELISAFTFVEEGTTQADTGWVCTINAGGTIGTNDVAFAQFSSAGAYAAGTGLSLSGNTFNVGGTTDRISVSADNIDIASGYVGQTSITTLGTIATGTWNATAIGVTKGGLGLTAAVNGLLKGNGSAYSVAVAGTDYLTPDSTIDGGTF